MTLTLDSGVGGIVLGNSENVVVMEEPNALIDDDGSITLSSGHYILNLNFDPISNVKKIRIDVMVTDAVPNGNVVLNEIEINPIDHDLQIIGCSASHNQEDYHCNEGYDGTTNERDNGWAYGGNLPAWVIYELAEKGTINYLRLFSGQQRNDHRLIQFKVK